MRNGQTDGQIQIIVWFFGLLSLTFDLWPDVYKFDPDFAMLTSLQKSNDSNNVNFFRERKFVLLPTDSRKSWNVTGNDNIFLLRLWG